MSLAIMPIRGVSKNYGVRKTGGANGTYKATGPVKTLSFKIDYQFLKDAVALGIKLPLSTFLPKGAVITDASLFTHKVFDELAALTLDVRKVADHASIGTFPIAAATGGLQALGGHPITGTAGVATDVLVSDENYVVVSAAAVPTALVGKDGTAELIITYVGTAV